MSISRRHFLRTTTAAAIGGLSGVSLLSRCAEKSAAQPNIIFFLIDDMGWTDVSYQGSRLYETPYIDELASRGMRFTQAYAASAVCSPTRSSIMTGKYPARLNQTDWIPGRGNSPENQFLQVEDLNRLPLEEVTIAERLQEAGYITCHIGKWHLGGEGHLPEDQGFDINIAGNRHGAPPHYFYPYKRGDYQLDELAETGEEGEYLTDRLGSEAVGFIRDHAEEPFFLYFSHYAVHTPRQAKKDHIQKYEDKIRSMSEPEGPEFIKEHDVRTKAVQDNPVYAGMVESTDNTVGMVMDTLGELGIGENTIIIFMSDNGGLATLPQGRTGSTANLPLRAGKGWNYEGGIREPMFIVWHGTVEPNSVSHEPVISTDFHPTILEMAGLPADPSQHMDGISLVPLLQGEPTLERDNLYWHYPHYHGSGARPHGAMRSGDWKLLEFYEDNSIELYNLAEDMGEQNEISADEPERTAAMHEQFQQWRKKVDAQMPKPNPNYQPSA